jgi:S1-C subfamily serine protease
VAKLTQYPAPDQMGIETTPIALGSRVGLRVTSVGVGGPGALAGLRAGDVVLVANGYLTQDNESLRRITAASNGILRLQVARLGSLANVGPVVVQMRAQDVPEPGAAAPR